MATCSLTFFMSWGIPVKKLIARAASVVWLVGALSCGDDSQNHLPDGPPNGPDSPATMASLSLDKSTADFGSVTVGSTSSPTTFTCRTPETQARPSPPR
jgi:hypothetical protein